MLLAREEYIEQAYFFRAYRERLEDDTPSQEILLALREEILATTSLPMAIDILRGEVLLKGRLSTAMSVLSHYFTPFQTFVLKCSEEDLARFDQRTALMVLEREAQYRTEERYSPAGLFIYQFECLSRNRLGYADGLRAVAADPAYSEDWRTKHALIKAKLKGFINPGQVAWAYDDRDTSLPAEYARAIAAYRDNQVEDSLKRIDALLARAPDNPYFHELKGQMLLEFGRPEDALASYRKALAIEPDAALIRAALGHALIESRYSNPADEQKNMAQAIQELERVLKEEPRYALVHRLLATAYGRLGNTDMAKVYLAEEAILQRKYDYARQQAEGVVNAASPDSKALLKAKDVLSYLEVHEKE